MENLGCANCAAKMEAKFNACPGVEAATITFATKQLRLTAAHPDELPEAKCLHLHLDARMSGVGSNSVGPELPKEYRINPGDSLSQHIYMAAIDLRQDDPFAFLSL